MATRPEPPRKPAKKPDELYPSDLIPLAEARETDSDSAWAAFSELTEKQNATFADTAPASEPMALPQVQGDPRYAPTQPSPLAANKPPQAAGRSMPSKAVTSDDVMVEARRNNRLCPQPVQWQQLYDMLPEKIDGPRGRQPAPPVGGGAWAVTPSLAKRMCLRDHIEWAESHGCLPAVHAFLKGLPEDQWHHMGD